jgi:ATP-dependent protease ClpP protease subunit
MAARSNTDDVLERGIDLANRRIYFGGNVESSGEENGVRSDGSDFTWRSCELAIRAIHIMENRSHQPIEIHMDSEGGDPYRMLRLVDVILASPCQIKFFGGGVIASSATWVMAVCDERYLLPNTMVLVHDSDAGEKSANGHLTDLYIDTDQEKKLQDYLNGLFADNSRMPKEFWDDIVKRDVFLSAAEAVSLGLADKVVDLKKRGNLRKVRLAALAQHPDKKELNKLVKEIYRKSYKTGLSKIEVTLPVEQFDPEVVIVTEAPAEEKPAATKAPSSGTTVS